MGITSFAENLLVFFTGGFAAVREEVNAWRSCWGCRFASAFTKATRLKADLWAWMMTASLSYSCLMARSKVFPAVRSSHHLLQAEATFHEQSLCLVCKIMLRACRQHRNTAGHW